MKNLVKNNEMKMTKKFYGPLKSSIPVRGLSPEDIDLMMMLAVNHAWSVEAEFRHAVHQREVSTA